MQKENVERICQTVTINSTFPYESFRSKFQQNPNSNSTTCCFHFQSPNDDKCETNNPKFPLSVRLKYAKVTLIRKKIKQITLINMHKDTIIAQQTDMRCNRHLNVIEQDLQGGKMQWSIIKKVGGGGERKKIKPRKQLHTTDFAQPDWRVRKYRPHNSAESGCCLLQVGTTQACQ